MHQEYPIHKINSLVKERIDEAIKLLKELIEIPTENPPGNNYLEMAYLLNNVLNKLGYKTEVVKVPQEVSDRLAPHGKGLPRVNVVGYLQEGVGGPLIHLNGHFDVVPAGLHWSFNPFKGIIKDNKVYGRGASDMKSGIVTQIFSVEVLREAMKELGYKLNGTIVQSFTCDEETGGFAGVGYLVDKGYISKNTNFILITEPTDSRYIVVGHRGVIWLKVKVYGEKAHGAVAQLGVNAIDRARLILNKFAELNLHLKSRVSENILPIEASYATLTPTMINAGLASNIVPDICEIVFDRRLSMNEKVDIAMEEMKKIVEETLIKDYDIEMLMSVEPVKVPLSTMLINTLSKSIELIVGENPRYYYLAATMDMKFFVRNTGINECVVYGPGIMSVAHMTNEYVPIENIITSIKVLSLTLSKLFKTI
ncbi:MAG: M20 family metallopeptidase [Candidatus Methanomethylicia archaeon]